jgi:hypothetical protein
MLRYLLSKRMTIAIASACVLALPCASASASDSLLSGYGGPGGGEQVLVSTKVLPPKSGDGSLRASPSGETSSGQSGATKQSRKKQPSSKLPGSIKAGAKPVYPAETSSAAGLPVRPGDLLVLLLGAGAIGLVALFFRRGFADR